MQSIAQPMTWEQMYTMTSNLLRGQSIDPVLFTQMLNHARMNREQEREWLILVKLDRSQMWNPGDTWQTAKVLPTDFGRWRERTPMTLWDGNQNPGSLVEPVNFIPYEDLIWFNTDSYAVAVDYANLEFFFAGTTTQPFIVQQNYIADFGDIVQEVDGVSSTWLKFPARFDPILPYDVASMFRLGVDYDDLAARNADGNNQQAEMIMASMRKWDANLQRSNIKDMDYFPPDTHSFTNRKINIGWGR